MKRLRLREWFGQGHTASRWRCRDLNPGSLAPDTIGLTITRPQTIICKSKKIKLPKSKRSLIGQRLDKLYPFCASSQTKKNEVDFYVPTKKEFQGLFPVQKASSRNYLYVHIYVCFHVFRVYVCVCVKTFLLSFSSCGECGCVCGWGWRKRRCRVYIARLEFFPPRLFTVVFYFITLYILIF